MNTDKLSPFRPVLMLGSSLLAVVLVGCSPRPDDSPAGPGGWLQGTTHEKLDTVARHLRGNDIVMPEVAYRYAELYWAGREGNWDYARYQLDKMRTTMELGAERRPQRAQSFAWFFENGFPPMREVVDAGDAELFRERFTVFTAACNTCHGMEQMPFVVVREPDLRTSIVKPRAEQ